MKTKPGFSARLEVLSSGRIPLDDFNSGYADPWTIMNGTAGYSFKAGKNWKFDVMATVSNITNEHYASMVVVNAPGAPGKPPRYYYPGMPRWVTFSAGVKYRFHNM
jgi:iron complex outermembrane receptor protein